MRTLKRPRQRTAAGLGLASRVVLCLVVLMAVACRSPEPPPTHFLLGGIQVREPDMDRWLETLREHGLNTVSVTVYARQGAWDSADLHYDGEGDWVIPEIEAAKKLGLNVVLILRVAVEHALPENLFLWHGMIMPSTDAQVDGWFERYGAFVERWARIAEASGVDVFGIGSELNALASTVPLEALPPLEEYYLNQEKQQRRHDQILQSVETVLSEHLVAGWGDSYQSLPGYLDDESAAHLRWARQVTYAADLGAMNRRRVLLEDRWRELIVKVREVYHGRLTYAANFDRYQEVGFWDALDLIGINAYFPLRSGREQVTEVRALLPIFEASWRSILGEVQVYRSENGLDERPVLLTELGYTYRADSTVAPWAGSGFSLLGEGDDDPELVVWQERPVEPMERALAVRALRRVSRQLDPELIQGLLYWKLSTQSDHRDIEPFVLILSSEDRDPLLEELSQFVQAPP